MTIDVRRRDGMPPGRHPCDRVAADLERLYRRRPDIRFAVTLSVELTRPRAVALAYVRTLRRGRGLASLVVDEMAASADRHDVTIDLVARASADDPRGTGLDQRSLEAFYARRGFWIVDRSDGAARMRRLAPFLTRQRIPGHDPSDTE